ncbi:hypothetical protein BpHYR1_015433, partial [Brachionus plicatilis]
ISDNLSLESLETEDISRKKVEEQPKSFWGFVAFELKILLTNILSTFRRELLDMKACKKESHLRYYLVSEPSDNEICYNYVIACFKIIYVIVQLYSDK